MNPICAFISEIQCKLLSVLVNRFSFDRWTGYSPLEKDFVNLVRVPSGKKGNNFPDLHRAIMMLKGMHHHVEHLQDYLNEYCYRFNRSFMKEEIFDNLMMRMVKSNPCPIKNISG